MQRRPQKPAPPRRHDGPSVLDVVERRNWDYIIVGDGSVQKWGEPIGWAAIVYHRDTGFDHPLTEEKGAASNGTVNVAELMPYVMTLNWIVAHEAAKRNTIGPQPVHVAIVTDSKYVADTGRTRKPGQLSRHELLWTAFDAAARQGILITWYWCGRENLAENSRADVLSKAMRRMMIPTTLTKKRPTSGGPGSQG